MKLESNINYTQGTFYLGISTHPRPLTLMGWLYLDVNSFKMEETSPSSVSSSTPSSFSFVSLLVSLLLISDASLKRLK